MNRVSMLSIALSIMAGFVYAEEAKSGGDASVEETKEAVAPAGETTEEAPVAE